MGTLSRSLSGRLILFIGAMVATECLFRKPVLGKDFQSLFIGAMVATSVNHSSPTFANPFSPFSSGQWLLLTPESLPMIAPLLLSVPFSSGQWLLQKSAGAQRARNAKLSVPFSSGQWLLLRPS